MNYSIQETVFDETRRRNAGSKAREDINYIARAMGFQEVLVQYDYVLRKEKGLFAAIIKLSNEWKRELSKLGYGDTVLIQFPINHHPFGIAEELDKYHKRGGKVIILIHDIDSFRLNTTTIDGKIKYLKVLHEDKSILKRGDVIIAHNEKMIQSLSMLGIDEKKVIPLGIFDYIAKYNAIEKSRNIHSPIIIAGTLGKSKAGYIYDLPLDINFNLYGNGYIDEAKKNIHYHGAFFPEELLGVMDGSFGLVWDGASSAECEGVSGQYLRINNPHKTSLYLTAGLPVIVWEDAAIAEFIMLNDVGVTVKRIADISLVVKSINDEHYYRMVKNACDLSIKLQNGHYAKSALEKAIKMLT